MIPRLLALSLAAFTLSLAACDGDDATTATDADASPGQDGGVIDQTLDARSGADSMSREDASDLSDGAVATTDAKGSCNAQVFTATDRVGVVLAVTDPPPVPAGGNIEDGSYVISKVVIYGRPTAVPPQPYLSGKVEILGGVWQSVFHREGKALSSQTTQTDKVTTSGTTISITKVCPSVAPPLSFSYTAANDGGKKTVTYFEGKAEVTGIVLEKI